jgi:hypothetical protein
VAALPSPPVPSDHATPRPALAMQCSVGQEGPDSLGRLAGGPSIARCNLYASRLPHRGGGWPLRRWRRASTSSGPPAGSSFHRAAEPVLHESTGLIGIGSDAWVASWRRKRQLHGRRCGGPLLPPAASEDLHARQMPEWATEPAATWGSTMRA